LASNSLNTLFGISQIDESAIDAVRLVTAWQHVSTLYIRESRPGEASAFTHGIARQTQLHSFISEVPSYHAGSPGRRNSTFMQAV
jgi:hypothetical protein